MCKLSQFDYDRSNKQNIPDNIRNKYRGDYDAKHATCVVKSRNAAMTLIPVEYLPDLLSKSWVSPESAGAKSSLYMDNFLRRVFPFSERLFRVHTVLFATSRFVLCFCLLTGL
jgi:hypothetical protein